MGANPLQGPLEGRPLKIETFLGPEMAMSETHVHKIICVTVFYTALGPMILMGVNPLLGPLEGVSPKNLDFFGQNDTLIVASNGGPKKS